MRGGLWLCLLVVLLLVPLAGADHKHRNRPIIDLDLGGDDDRDDERDDEDRDDDDKDDDRDDEDGDRSAPGRGGRDASALSAECAAPSGGATEDGNVVAWSARQESMVVHRRAGDGDWQQVHSAQPGEELFIDRDLTKGRTYAYKVVAADAAIAPCPMLEMKAVPFFPALWAAGVGLAAYAVARRR